MSASPPTSLQQHNNNTPLHTTSYRPMYWHTAPLVVSFLLSQSSSRCHSRQHPPLRVGDEGHGTKSPTDPLCTPLSVRRLQRSRRRQILKEVVATAAFLGVGWGVSAAPAVAVTTEDDSDPNGSVAVTLTSPSDRLGVELYATAIFRASRDSGSRPEQTPVVAIRRVPPSSLAAAAAATSQLQPGLVLRDYPTLQALQERLQNGPYPVRLVFVNLAAGGDARSDTGAPLVTAADALQLAQQPPPSPSSSASASLDKTTYRVDILSGPRQCPLQSRRNDVLEIIYQASFLRSSSSSSDTSLDDAVRYDASANRGTGGQPYQMVLGSGDMLPGVDLGLYEMCPGQRRRLTIPPRLGYGRKGNRLWGVPPDATLVWDVELVRINGAVGVDNQQSRDDLEQRVPYQ